MSYYQEATEHLRVKTYEIAQTLNAPLIWQQSRQEPPDARIWLYGTVSWLTANVISVGIRSTTYTGLYRIQLLVQQGDGSDDINFYADQVTEVFEAGYDAPLGGSGQLTVFPGGVAQTFQDRGREAVNIDFTAQIQECR